MGNSRLLVFDLDDTLYLESSYSRSALRSVAKDLTRSFGLPDCADELIGMFAGGEADTIGICLARHKLPESAKSELIAAMQKHAPDIELRADAAKLLDTIRTSGEGYAIVTDGRSATQRAKIKALGCDDALFISVSEECGLSKTDVLRWLGVEAAIPRSSYCYIGDNPAKDFLVPNLLGWETVMLAGGRESIHPQHFPSDQRYHPGRVIDYLDELIQ